MSISNESKVVTLVLAMLLLLVFVSGVSAGEPSSGPKVPVFQSPTAWPNGTIRGAAFMDSNRNGKMDPGENGIGGVYFTVSQGDYSHTYYSEKRTEDEAGNKYATGYYGPVLTPGNWIVTLHVPPGYVATVPVEQEVFVAEAGWIELNLGLYSASGAAASGAALLPATGLGRNGLILTTLIVLGIGVLVAVALGVASRAR